MSEATETQAAEGTHSGIHGVPQPLESGSDLAALAHALARTVARQRGRGHRRALVLPAHTPPPNAPRGEQPSTPSAHLAGSPTGGIAAPAGAARTPSAATPPPAAAPLASPAPSPAPSDAPSPLAAPESAPIPAAAPIAPPEAPVILSDPDALPPRPIPNFQESTRPKRPDLVAQGVAPDAAAGPLKGLHPRETAAGIQTLDALKEAVAGCEACALCETRTQTVFMDGPLSGPSKSRILFVGEAPGADEDRLGQPFVGPAGALLTDIITKGMGLAREDVSIANVLKCRPPGNRDPLPAEAELCTGWLDRQIALIDPLVIVPLGRHAACHILGHSAPLGRLRAQVHEVNGRKVVPTYHPAYLLRAPHEKKKAWEDIQLAMAEAGLPLPSKR